MVAVVASNVLGERLRQLRERRGLRQEDVARYFQTGKSTVSQWESGKRRPDLETLQRLARFYNTTIAYLVGETDNPSPTPQPDSGDAGAQLEYFLRGTGRLSERDIKVILRLFEELARAGPDVQE